MRASKTTILLLFLILAFTSNQAQTKWFMYAGNPVLERGEPGEWDGNVVSQQCALWDGSKYNMWYSGDDGEVQAIGYATSTDGISWEKYAGNPVLERGASGEWDDVGIEPNSAIFDGTLYKLWYGGWGGGPAQVGLATSPDGINWTKDTLNNPVLSPGESGSWDDDLVADAYILYDNSSYKMWYGGLENSENLDTYVWRLGYAESNDGINWTKHPDPIMEEGDYETWWNNLFNPFVIYENNNYTMWYATNDRNFQHAQINCATSSDGIEWAKFEGNPVLPQDTYKFKPSVIKENNLYKMWYGGSGNFGYAEDFSHFVHADSVMVDGTYINPNGDPINILGRVISPEGHALTAKAMILSDDGTTTDSVELFDDGLNGDGVAADGICGGNWSTKNEKNYTVGIKTVDEMTSFTRNGLNWNIIDRFTTKGPIHFESFEITTNDTVPNPGDRFKFALTLISLGIADTVYDVNVNIIMPDNPYIVNSTTGKPFFGDIAAGESLTNSSSDFAFTLFDSCSVGQYEFGLEITSKGEMFWYSTFTIEVVEITSDIDVELSELPKEFALGQNYPNPFNPSTTLKYEIPKENYITLKVYDILGREVATLVNRQQKAGYYEIGYNAQDLTSGIYFYRIQAGEFVDTKKMLLLR